MDKSSLMGVALAIGGILLGLMLEGGRITQIIQPTAAMIVFGGTLGAVMIQFPLRVILAALRRLGQAFVDNATDPRPLDSTTRRICSKSPQRGNRLARQSARNIQDPFLRRA